MDTNQPAGSTPPPPPPPPAGGGTPPPVSGGEIIYPSQPPKDPVLILVLNLILFAVGYFIYGQWQKGVAGLVAAFVVLPIVSVVTCGMGVFLYPACMIFTAIDGFMQAEQLKAGYPLGQWTFFKDHK